MTHNPFANAYPVGGRPWSAEDDAALINARAAGGRYEYIASDLKRTIAAVRSRDAYLKLSADQRRERQKQQGRHIVRMKIDHNVERTPAVPEEAWADRNRRMSEPRTLTAWLMGDPASPAAPTNPRVLA